MSLPHHERLPPIARAVAAAAARHLPEDAVISDIARSLSSRAAHRLAAACPRWRAILSQPTFLCRHLAPRPLAGERPRALIVQPRKLGFTHLTLVAIDPTDPLAVNVPVRNKYARHPRLYRERHRRIISNASAADEPQPEPEPDRFADHLTPGSDVVDADDHVAFFERTVPALDISIVAAHGRLLLARGRSCYYVCDAADNRWVALPPSDLPPEHGTNSGLHYDDLDDASSATGRLAFTVVLIGCRHRRVVVETFTSATGRWETKELPEQGTQDLACCVGGGPASPGIHVGGCFYWLTHHRGRILRYDVAGGRVSVVREPTEAEGSIGRAGRSLGSTGGRLRMCAFDVRDDSDESDSQFPHDGGVGVHGVWVMTTDEDDGGAVAPAWRRVHEATVDDVGFYYFHMLFDRETPVDFAGACGDFVVLEDSRYRFWRYNYLESGDNCRVELWNLKNPKDDNLRELYERNHVSDVFCDLYRRYHVFPFFG